MSDTKDLLIEMEHEVVSAGKLLERIGDPAKALRVYKRGMEVATTADDHHSYTELQAAYEDLEDLETE